MSPYERLYCYICRRSLTSRAFNLEARQNPNLQICQTCLNQLRSEGTMTTPTEVVIETERMIQLTLQGREGGEPEVETPAGFVDLVTDDHAIEIKHVTDWKDGAKVLIYAQYLPGKKPRVHLFGGYAAAFREMVEKCYTAMGVIVTWERESF